MLFETIVVQHAVITRSFSYFLGHAGPISNKKYKAFLKKKHYKYC
jgi:hypothetical protein